MLKPERKARRQYERLFRIKNRERLNAYHRKWRKRLSADRYAHILKRNRKWRKKNNRHARKRDRLKYAKNPAYYSEKNRRSYKKNWKAWYAKNRKKIRTQANRLRQKRGKAYWNQYQFEWRMKNIEKIRKWELRRRQSAKGKIQMLYYAAKRRALKRGCTVEESEKIKAFYIFVATAKRITCHWCKKNVPKGKRHVDHVHPLSRKGKHARRNLVASCARCNLTKHDKLPSEFLRRVA